MWVSGSQLSCHDHTWLTLLCFDWTSHIMQIHWTASFFPFFLFPTPKPMYNMDLVWNPCMKQSWGWPLYNIYLRATITMILSIRGVTIPIDLVSSTTDSIRWSVVLFKPVSVPISDPKSEFLYQLSLHCAEPTDPWTTSYTWDISHTLVTTYYPYCNGLAPFVWLGPLRFLKSTKYQHQTQHHR